MPAPLISQADAAERLGVDVSTIRRWIAAGKIRAFRVGNRKTIRIDPDSLNDLLTPIGGWSNK